MNSWTRVWLASCLVFSLGCLFPDDPEEDDTPPADIDGCSDDHDEHWLAGADGQAIVVAENETWTPADQICNQIAWHSATGGGQGGDTFHIEPTVEVALSDDQYAIHWFVDDIEGQNLLEQGIEIFPEEWDRDEDAGVMRYTSQLFVYPEHRGKNLRLRAYLQPTGGTGVDLEAAVLLGGASE